MRLVQALENEQNRTDRESWRKIFIHKDGKFYHIYEWSAWLVKAFICTEEFQKARGDEKILAANRYKYKDGDYVIIGFPIESINKYLPEYENAQALEVVDLELEIDIPFDEDETYKHLMEVFAEWKASCPFKETKTKSHKEIRGGSDGLPALDRSGVFQILSEIIAYPVENMTPSENMIFISNIKQRIAALL